MRYKAKISIIIPVYNEEATIEEIVKQVSLSLPGFQKEIIIINDGSTDKTSNIIRQKILPNFENIVYEEYEKNKGKGFAIRTALKHLRGYATIIQDADLEYDPDDYPQLIGPILADEVKITYGSRMANFVPSTATHVIYKFGNQIITKLFNLLYNTNLADLSTGYKAFETKLLKSLNLKCIRFEFCHEITAKLARLGYMIKEVPIAYSARSAKEGKKIKFIDALVVILVIFKYRFIPCRNFKKTA